MDAAVAMRLLHSILLLLSILAAVVAAAATHLAVLQDLRKSLTNADACSWPHVSCDQSGQVDNLDLKQLGLASELPASFSILVMLRGLSLQGNRLSVPLPSFCSMASLEQAFLNDNAFDSIPYDSVVLVNLTAAAVLFGNLLVAKGVHALAIKEGFESREDLAASLVNLYAKCGDLLSAREVFDSLCCKNVVLWTSMLNAFGSIPANFFQGRQPARRHSCCRASPPFPRSPRCG